MNRGQLLAWAFRLGFPWAILLALGGAMVGPRAAAAQYPMEGAPEQGGADLVPVPGATPRAVSLRGRAPCDEVVSAVDHSPRAGKGLNANIAVIAKRLGTTQVWAAHCLLAYGRRIPASIEESANEDVLEKLEEDEPEESAAEDVSEPGAKERNLMADENSKDRQELRASNPNPNKPAPEKESVLRIRPEAPEQNPDSEYNQGFR